MEPERVPRPLAELAPRSTHGGPPARLRAADWPDPLPAHVGLWLDRIVALEPSNGRQGGPDGNDEGSRGKEERRRLYEVAVAALRVSGNGSAAPAVAAYGPLFRRWQDTMQSDPPGLVRRKLEVEALSRLLIHPATNATVTEGSILLHHTYGVPYLPGSALKGVLRRRLEACQGPADELLGRGATADDQDDLAAAVDVFDALWIPDHPAKGVAGSPLALDVVTPHHPKYYTGGADRPLPTDYDEPTPVHRLSVAPGTHFWIVLETAATSSADEWLDALIERVLLPALREDGIGAWTSIGYGRLDRPGSRSDRGATPTTPKSPPTATPERAPAPSGWRSAEVQLNPGPQELVALLPEGKAVAGRQETNKLLAGLSEEAQAALRSRRRSVRLEIRIERVGLGLKIVDLRAPNRSGSPSGDAG